MQEMVESEADGDDDEIVRGLFEPDSDDEDEKDQAPESKDEVTKENVDDPPTVVVPEGKRQRLSLFHLAQALNLTEAKKILQELSKNKEFQMPQNRRQRRTLKQNGWNTDVAEAYSPPRVTKVASDMKLRPAWAFDLTEIDPEDGLPWDLSDPVKQARAKKKQQEDSPMMLVTCPMCGPFSSLMHWNYAKMQPEEIKKKLHAAISHVKFSLDMCLEQYKQGRCFLFEHPAGASSWELDMMKQMMELEGVYVAKFDFCALGMESVDDNGEKGAAKKRTTILTNSKHIAEVLRQAQCSKLHRHIHLTNGKAGPCQKYPDKFVELIILGVKREISDVKWRTKVAEKLDISACMEKLIAATEEFEREEALGVRGGHRCPR